MHRNRQISADYLRCGNRPYPAWDMRVTAQILSQRRIRRYFVLPLKAAGKQRDLSHVRFTEQYIKRYGNAYELPSPNAKELMGIFQRICKEKGILSTPDECFRFMQELPDKYRQMSIFDM